MKYLLLLIVAGLISCETDSRTISVYTLKFCDQRNPEMVYCSSQFNITPTIDTWKQAVPVFTCIDMNNTEFSRLNVCDTVLITRSVGE